MSHERFYGCMNQPVATQWVQFENVCFSMLTRVSRFLNIHISECLLEYHVPFGCNWMVLAIVLGNFWIVKYVLRLQEEVLMICNVEILHSAS